MSDASYVQFIRAFLINACYMEYSKQVHENKNNELFEYSILKAKDDKSIWDEIFKKYYQLFRYYQYLTMEIIYSQNQMTTTYSPISFQDFIDERITFQSVGYREYQRFIKSMQDTTFKNNLIKKYQTEVNSRSLKNHIIYVVFLCISKQIGNSTYFTSEEQECMDISLNPIAYFNYISKLERCSNNDIDNLEQQVICQINSTF